MIRWTRIRCVVCDDDYDDDNDDDDNKMYKNQMCSFELVLIPNYNLKSFPFK